MTYTQTEETAPVPFRRAPLVGLLALGALGALGGCAGRAPLPQQQPAVAAPRCPEGMALIAPGEFTIGAERRSQNFDPLTPRRARVERAFCLDRTEVSVAAYRRCVADGQCEAPAGYQPQPGNVFVLCNWNRPGAEQHALNCVTWRQASNYCAWRGHAGGARRLPSDVEWEFAARGAEARPYAWGTSLEPPARGNLCGAECTRYLATVEIPDVPSIAGWSDPFETTAPVDSMPESATPEGVLHLTGNVSEWVRERFVGERMPTTELTPGPDGSVVVLRGGSWLDTQRHAHAASRSRELVTGWRQTSGMRCARDLP